MPASTLSRLLQSLLADHVGLSVLQQRWLRASERVTRAFGAKRFALAQKSAYQFPVFQIPRQDFKQRLSEFPKRPVFQEAALSKVSYKVAPVLRLPQHH